MVMFDFSDTSNHQYRNFQTFVDIDTNTPKPLSSIDRSILPYPYLENVEPPRIFVKEDFLSPDECDYLIWLAESGKEWLQETIPFWVDRNLPFFTTLQRRNYVSPQTQQLSLSIHAKIKEFITKSFGEEVNADQMGIVRWPPGSWQMCHVDEVAGMDRVAGCVVFLNGDFEGGKPFYPYYDKTIQPKTGMIYAHDPGQSHLHGVTRISGSTRYTISSTWTRNMDINPYKNELIKMRNYLNACVQPEQPVSI
jgi:hypothetical protein